MPHVERCLTAVAPTVEIPDTCTVDNTCDLSVTHGSEVEYDFLHEANSDYDRDFLVSSTSADIVASSLALSPSNFTSVKRPPLSRRKNSAAQAREQDNSIQKWLPDTESAVQSPGDSGSRRKESHVPGIVIQSHQHAAKASLLRAGKGSPEPRSLSTKTLSLDVPAVKHREGMQGGINSAVMSIKIKPRTPSMSLH
jgi:hypothetical protein